jgi:hypothetical protein
VSSIKSEGSRETAPPAASSPTKAAVAPRAESARTFPPLLPLPLPVPRPLLLLILRNERSEEAGCRVARVPGAPPANELELALSLTREPWAAGKEADRAAASEKSAACRDTAMTPPPSLRTSGWARRPPSAGGTGGAGSRVADSNPRWGSMPCGANAAAPLRRGADLAKTAALGDWDTPTPARPRWAAPADAARACRLCCCDATDEWPRDDPLPESRATAETAALTSEPGEPGATGDISTALPGGGEPERCSAADRPSSRGEAERAGMGDRRRTLKDAAFP